MFRTKDLPNIQMKRSCIFNLWTKGLWWLSSSPESSDFHSGSKPQFHVQLKWHFLPFETSSFSIKTLVMCTAVGICMDRASSHMFYQENTCLSSGKSSPKRTGIFDSGRSFERGLAPQCQSRLPTNTKKLVLVIGMLQEMKDGSDQLRAELKVCK